MIYKSNHILIHCKNKQGHILQSLGFGNAGGEYQNYNIRW